MTSTAPAAADAVERLRRSPRTDPGVAALAERLLTANPGLPLTNVFASTVVDPGPDQPAAILHVDVRAGDTEAVAAWAAAVGAQVQADGAIRYLDTVIDGIGLYISTVIPEDQYQVEVFAPTPDDFPALLHGVHLAELGEDEGGLLVALGHLPARRFLAAVSAWPRVMYGMRYVPRDPLREDHPLRAPQHAWARGEAYPTRSEPRFVWCAPDSPGAVPITHLSVDVHGLESEDRAPLARCPVCRRASRSTTYGWLPGGYDATGPVHTCSRCGHRWPA